VGGVNQRARVIEPLNDRGVFGLVEIKLNSFEGVDIKNVVAVVEWRLLVIKWRKPHSLEMPTVPLLSTHSKPHTAPLSVVYGLNDARDLIHKGDGSSDVIEHWNLAYLLPREGDVFEQLHDGMGDILQRTKMNSLVISELAIGHIPVVFYDFAHMFRRHILCNTPSRT